jgi:hypothetical protein
MTLPPNQHERALKASAALFAALDEHPDGRPLQARPILDALRQLAVAIGPVILQILLKYLDTLPVEPPTA